MLQCFPNMSIYNFISLLGIIILILCAWILSTNRKEVNWHTVIWGVGLQFLFAWFLFVFPIGIKFFMLLNDGVVALLNSSVAGARFLFGPLADSPGTGSSIGFILAFQAFPAIIFFSSLMSILYFYNIMPVIIKAFAKVFTKLMKVSGAESVCSASNIFVGVESALTVKPFLKNMTASELNTILTVGMATVSSNILAIYVFSLQDVFANIAGHLVSASFLSAPAALAISKILYPEEESPETLGENIDIKVDKQSNLLEAIIEGANNGVKLIVGIAALLIAVLGLVALLDSILIFVSDTILKGVNINLSLKSILGMIFYPFILILGVPFSDVGVIAGIVGERIILTEIVSYQDLNTAVKTGMLHGARSAVITTYALCGFAHVASMAIFVGGISAIIPEKTKVLASLGLRSLLGATLACLLTACVAGVFFVNKSVLF